MKTLFLIITILLQGIVSAQPCPKSGNSKTPEKKKLNTLKNAGVTVSSSRTPEFLPLKNLIPSRKRKDKALYMDGAYITTEGYLVSFEEQGGEACNCDKADKKKKNGDVHMYVGLKPDAVKNDCIVVEITPAFKKKNPGYAALLGKNIQVRITGFLLYDFIHEPQAVNTCSSCVGTWRRTCWEIHPVTDIVKL